MSVEGYKIQKKVKQAQDERMKNDYSKINLDNSDAGVQTHLVNYQTFPRRKNDISFENKNPHLC